MKKVFDLAWGESCAVRDAFLKTKCNAVTFDKSDLQNMGYPAHEGDPRLIELTKKIIKRNTGNDYKYILITNGATGAATIALRRFAINGGKTICVTRPAPYFRLYPKMIDAAGLIHLWDVWPNLIEDNKHNLVYLVDSLSNPTGTFSQQAKDKYNNPIIWDAVYFGNIYAPGFHPQPQHDVLVGSYSKLTGLNGLRVGWIATNNERLYEDMRGLVTAEYCGISAASTKVILDTAGRFTDLDWKFFETTAQKYLDYNREEFSKLEKYFGGKPVEPYGMFYYADVDSKCKELLEKSGIIWSPGSQLGTDDRFGRFNVGQDVQVVKEAVQAVLKNDKC